MIGWLRNWWHNRTHGHLDIQGDHVSIHACVHLRRDGVGMVNVTPTSVGMMPVLVGGTGEECLEFLNELVEFGPEVEFHKVMDLLSQHITLTGGDHD